MIRFIVILLVFIITTHINHAQANKCYIAGDFGMGGVFYIPANPDEDNPNSTSALLRTTPLSQQIAPWVSTGLSTTGLAKGTGSNNNDQGILKIYVSGAWGPWGGNLASLPECQLKACDANLIEEQPCMTGGKIVDYNDINNIPCRMGSLDDSSGQTISSNTLGWGLYGLIALTNPSSQLSPNPNDPSNLESLPAALFRTFRLAPLQQDNDGYYFEMDSTQTCEVIAGTTTCKTDANAQGQTAIPEGALYFKTSDSYYQDNVGGFEINIISNVYAPRGFIESTIDGIISQLSTITYSIYQAVTVQSGFLYIIRAILVLYIVITGFGFMTGMLKINQGELFIRLFKFAIVSILLTKGSWDFFNNYLFSLFTLGAQSIADLMISATATYNAMSNNVNFVLPENASSLSVFDVILRMCTSGAVNAKIWSLLFYKWYSVYIPLFYVCLYFMILAIIRSVILYLSSIIIIAIMLVISPIFLSFILFKFTKELFDGWLKQLMASAMQLIIVAGTFVLMMTLITTQLETLLHYKVCWKIVWSLDIPFTNWNNFQYEPWHILDIWFWHPASEQQVDAAITPIHFFAFLIVSILFNGFMQEIPGIIDTLSGAFLMPITKFYGAAMQTIENSFIYQKASFATDVARAYLPQNIFVNYVSNKLTKNAQGQPNMLGKAIGIGRGGINIIKSKFDN